MRKTLMAGSLIITQVQWHMWIQTALLNAAIMMSTTSMLVQIELI